MSKFIRTYTMEVQGRSLRKYTITDPITLILQTDRRAYGSLNEGSFMLYNLAEKTRRDLQFDNAIDAALNDGKGLSFNLKAGYESEGFRPTIFDGQIQRALSYRAGPNVVTEITVLDSSDAVQYAQVERTRNFPWTPENEMRALVGLMSPYGVRMGAIGSLFRGFQATRGMTWIGSVWDCITKAAQARGGYACIQGGKVYIMAQNDVLVIPGSLPQLDASTGLIDTPRRSGWVVDAQMVFEPRIQPLQELKVVSSVNSDINGNYCVQSVAHRGIISKSKDGGLITALSLMTLPESINRVMTDTVFT